MRPVARRAGGLKRFLEARAGSMAVAYVETSSPAAIGFDEIVCIWLEEYFPCFRGASEQESRPYAPGVGICLGTWHSGS